MEKTKIKSSSARDCLILICNPKLNYSRGAGIGSIIAAKIHCDTFGAVYWDFPQRVTMKNIKSLYFYDTSQKLITHKANLKIFDSENVPNKDKKYYPHFRKPYFHLSGWTALKIYERIRKTPTPKKIWR